ncbi:probable E3 ubiquitin-protein ligase makorin-1 [Belonocnema kinseyi]|uniref:probable E3 ubiquitin-protein ligase makorin-1 n=1 Tax=Belonocnema kinseyi TaxID=2817044 RepID=UPI00143CD8A2|nr:probable E3 ubiquitin-protein ligase makorin-1 [Belonocnema kinseyi]
MADNWTQNPQNMICRYFKNGMCREGNNCRYRHVQGSQNNLNLSHVDLNPEVVYLKSTTVCRFFNLGTCKFGNRCRFSHNSNNHSTATETANSEPRTSNSSSTSDSERISDAVITSDDWANAPEFIPSSIPTTAAASYCAEGSGASLCGNVTSAVSYAQVVNASSGQTSISASDPLCPYAESSGICKKLNCPYLHGDICELCGCAALHPLNEESRKKHTNACVKQHEVDMEISFAIARSRDKSCGVCFETIMEKSSREQRFGILPNCNHCFCLTCIRKWRQAKQFENKIIRACPECRIPSDFVCPSMYWVDTKEEKDKLITDYKGALSTKDCKYFKKGRGKCPFGNKCFYLHALPDGTKTDVGPPVRQRRNADSDIDIFHQLLLWDFLDERGNRWMYSFDDFDDIINNISDSDSDDWSEYEVHVV